MKKLLLLLIVLGCTIGAILGTSHFVSAADSDFNINGGIRSVTIKSVTVPKDEYNNHSITVYYTNANVTYNDLINYLYNTQEFWKNYITHYSNNLLLTHVSTDNQYVPFNTRLAINSNYYSYLEYTPTVRYYSNQNYDYYNQGKSDGISIGYDNGYKVGKQEGYDNGYSVGYNKGVSSASNDESINFNETLLAIMGYPITFFQTVFNFEIFGVNLFGVISAIISLMLALWLLRKVI